MMGLAKCGPMLRALRTTLDGVDSYITELEDENADLKKRLGEAEDRAFEAERQLVDAREAISELHSKRATTP